MLPYKSEARGGGRKGKQEGGGYWGEGGGKRMVEQLKI